MADVRTFCLQWPLLLLVALLGLSRLAGRVAPFIYPSRFVWRSLATCAIAALVALALAFLLLPVRGTGLVTSIGVLAWRGLPVYPPIDAAERYGILYGPLTYLKFLPFYAVFGASTFVAKVPGVLALAVTLTSAHAIARRFTSSSNAWLALGMLALLLLYSTLFSFDTQADAWILACVTASLCAALRWRRGAAICAVAIAFGLVPNLKLSAVLVMIPVLTLVWARFGGTSVAAVVAGGLPILAAPFLLPNVSLRNYVSMLEMAGRHGIAADVLRRNLQWMCLWLTPLLGVHGAIRRALRAFKGDWRGYDLNASVAVVCLTATLCTMTIIAVVGSKTGSGEWHLIPFLPIVLMLTLWFRSLADDARPLDVELGRIGLPAVAVLLAFITFAGGGTFHTVASVFGKIAFNQHAIAEIDAALTTYRGQTIEIGYGERPDPATTFKTLLAFAGQPYTVDHHAIQDHQLAGYEIPPATVDYLDRCGTRIWLIPAGQRPFLENNAFFPGEQRPLFTAAFRDAFARRYTRIARGEVFDVWACGGGGRS